MTNNPTIDGVSRELAEKTFSALKRLSAHITVSGNDLKEGREIADELRKLLDAPAVERQGPAKCGNCGSTSADICNQKGCGFLESGNGEPEVAALQSTLFDAIAHGDDAHRGWLKAAIDAHFSRSPMPEYVPSGKDQTVDALQSTIARLEARITQLESEAEFAAATYQAARDRIAELTHISEDFLKLADTPSNLPLGFGADLLKRIRVCLEATAALNTVHVDELDPGQRLALARGDSFIAEITGDWDKGWTFIDANKTSKGQGVCFAFPPGTVIKW